MQSMIVRMVLAIFVCSATVSTSIVAQDASRELSIDDLEQEMETLAEQFTLTVQGAETPCERIKALRWNNPARGAVGLGLTFLFVDQGRPAAVCCVYPWEGMLTYEFGSLSRMGLTARVDDQVIWTPPGPAVAFLPIPDAPAPAKSPAARLLQMKKLSQRFGSTLLGWRDDDGDRQELRAAAKPAFRYQNPTGDVIDGIVVSFTMGVDPETLLLIEAVQGADSAHYEYGFVRRTSGALEGTLDGQRVWYVDKSFFNRDPNRDFFAFRVATALLAKPAPPVQSIRIFPNPVSGEDQ